MSRPVQIIYDALAERWEIGYAAAVGTTVPIDVGQGVAVGRNATGDVVELVVDAPTMPTAALEQISDTFGDAVAEVIRSAVPGRDLELQVAMNLPARPETTTIAIHDEPGVPAVSPRGGHRVPTPMGELELHMSRGELRLRLPADFGAPNWWVRISDGESGDLLAMAPVLPVEGGTEAALSFGLDLPPEQLHVHLTTRPLVAVGARLERRAAWVEDLLTQAADVRRTRPRLARRLAARAREVALLMGDTERRRRAERIMRRGRRWGLGSMSMLTLVAVVAAGLLLAGRNSTPDIGPGNVGPATFTLADDSSVGVSLVGLFPNVAPGEVVPLTIAVTSHQRWSFGPPPDGDLNDPAVVEERSRETCLGISELSGQGLDVTLDQYSFEIRLNRVVGDVATTDRVLVGRFIATNDVLNYTTDKDSCRAPQFGAANRFEADTTVRRAPQIIDLALPKNLPPGLWEVVIDGPSITTERRGTVRLRVTP